MKLRLTVFALTTLLLSTTIIVCYYMTSENQKSNLFYVGVTFCGNKASDAKLLVDKVKTYTNLFVLQSGSLQQNLTAVNEIGDYAVASGLNYLVYFGTNNPLFNTAWFDAAKQRWGDQLVGVYIGDEPAGKRLDSSTYLVPHESETSGYSILDADRTIFISVPNGTTFTIKPDGTILIVKPDEPIHIIESDGTVHVMEANGSISTVENTGFNYNFSAYIPQNYDEAAKGFVKVLQSDIPELKNQSITTFTSDYALCWFDYTAEYDVVLVHFGWNLTTAQQVALVRGAATMQSKAWGAVITWRYDTPPYLDSPEEIYDQMRTAYRCGAEYVIIFNYATTGNNSYGSMQDGHFRALERFWNDVVKNPQEIHGGIKAEAALVLPRNYGFGMRNPGDNIWGLWRADNNSERVWDILQETLDKHELKTDIVYDDAKYPVAGKYGQIVYWNQTS